jgi:hypothetical protein
MLDFSNDGFENLFKKALKDGINLFCGAGFSVESMDKSGKILPVGKGLLDELKMQFPLLKSYNNLPRACTKLTQTDKSSFYAFIKNRFSVCDFSDLYFSLLKIKIKNIYTTNIDDLFFKIFEYSSEKLYLNDSSNRGKEYTDNYSINYFPLHGCVRSEPNYVFGTTEIASAFSNRNKNSWSNLAADAANDCILFWGWNFEDSGPIEAMYGGNNKIDENINKWVLLRNPSEEMKDYLKSLRFNIIIGDTKQMLEYISDFINKEELIPTPQNDEVHLFKNYQAPENNKSLASYRLDSFFLDYTPRWSHIYSEQLPKLTHYKHIADLIETKNDIIGIGIRGSGKTTLLMQLIAFINTNKPKHVLYSPTLDQAKIYLKILNGRKSILFIDDCFRDTDAIIELLKARNVQLVCFDRDYNFEQQSHRIKDLHFEFIDITQITQEDAQSIINIIPKEIKKFGASTKRFDKDPTILNLLAANLKSLRFNFIKDFYNKDPDAARVFLMICYVHSCGVPCSFDMVYSFMSDDKYSWEQMYETLKRAGGLIKDLSEVLGQFDILDSLQNYYQCRSRFFAEKIIQSIPKGNSVFSNMLMDFANNVPPYKICQYDKFKRSGYDADFAERAFTNPKDGEQYYFICAQKDETEYIYQQAAIYFSRKERFKSAFNCIEKARNLAHYNRFSIDSTYAKIYFDVNINVDQLEAEKALEILSECCTKDKRKSIHFSTFARCALAFHDKYPSSNSLDYIVKALSYIKDGLDDKNLSLSNSNKWDLKNLEIELTQAQNATSNLVTI